MEDSDNISNKPVSFIKPVINPLKEDNPTIEEKTSQKKEPEISNKPSINKKSVNRNKVAKEIKYKSAEHQNPIEFLKKNIPKELIPTNRTGYILGYVYLAVIIIALLQFPLGSLLSGKTDISISVGIPMPFLVFDVLNPLSLPIRFGGLIVDLIIYLFIAYAIDILIGYFLNSFKKIKEEKERPKIFKTAKRKDLFSNSKKEKVVNKVPVVEKEKEPLMERKSKVEVTEV